MSIDDTPKRDMEREANPSAKPRFAVVLKAYTWDAFVERQAQRGEANSTGGDFFVSFDETREPGKPIPHHRVHRTSVASALALGLANRFGERSLFWWNADYAHIEFFQAHPDYDVYTFLEYDTYFNGDLGRFAQRFVAKDADFTALPFGGTKEDWFWTRPHLATYTLEELEACLISVSAFSRRALKHLSARRLEASLEDKVPYWPLAEAFLPTEVKRAGFRFIPLAEFGDTTLLDWSPPLWEGTAQAGAKEAFMHPVYDNQRYVRWALKQGSTPSTFLASSGRVRRALAPLPAHLYAPSLAQAVCKSAVPSLQSRMRRLMPLGKRWASLEAKADQREAAL